MERGSWFWFPWKCRFRRNSINRLRQLWNIRTYLGNMMGSLESWLLLRSLRTLHLRVPRQSENGYGLAQWLSKAAGVRLLPLFLSARGRRHAELLALAIRERLTMASPRA